MATLSNKWKLAAMARETQEYSRNNQSQNSAALGITEDYIGQVSEGKGYLESIPGIQQDRVRHLGCTVQDRRISLELTNTDILRNHFKNIPEH